MNKPNGYDEVKAAGEWEAPKTGGHYMVVKKVEERKSSSGKDMIVVFFDFAAKDSQPMYFTNEYQNDMREERKWPYAGTSYIMVNDYKDDSKTSKNFKTFITCIEKSNKGFETSWGGNEWGAQFAGKAIGGVFGRVESEYNGQTSLRSQLRWFCSIDAVATAKVPEDKLLPTKTSAPPVTGNEPFMVVPDSEMDAVPF